MPVPTSDTSQNSDSVKSRGRTGHLPGKRVILALNGVLIGYWLAMFAGTHIPRPERIIGRDVSDKLLHFSAYFVLYSLLMLRSRILSGVWPNLRQHAKYLTITLCYAVADELLQGFPGVNRSPDVADAVADGCGVITAAVLTGICSRFFPVHTRLS